MRATAIGDLDAFRACRRACLAAVRHALDDDAFRLDDGQIIRLLDCAELCETTIRFRRRGSPLHPRLCAVCVEVCERCVALCEGYHADPVMRACARACRRCADICRTITGGSSPAAPGAGGPGGPSSRAGRRPDAEGRTASSHRRRA